MKAWIARDKEGGLCIYNTKPIKSKMSGWWDSPFDCLYITNEQLPEGISPQGGDNEPIEVELTIKKHVV